MLHIKLVGYSSCYDSIIKLLTIHSRFTIKITIKSNKSFHSSIDPFSRFIFWWFSLESQSHNINDVTQLSEFTIRKNPLNESYGKFRRFRSQSIMDSPNCLRWWWKLTLQNETSNSIDYFSITSIIHSLILHG